MRRPSSIFSPHYKQLNRTKQSLFLFSLEQGFFILNSLPDILLQLLIIICIFIFLLRNRPFIQLDISILTDVFYLIPTIYWSRVTAIEHHPWRHNEVSRPQNITHGAITQCHGHRTLPMGPQVHGQSCTKNNQRFLP